MTDCQECARLRALNADLIAELAIRAGTTVAVQVAAHEAVGPQDVDAPGPARPGPR